MALSTTPTGRADVPDVIVKQTDTDSTASADVFSGSASLYSLQLDNSGEATDDVFFKFYNLKGVNPASDLPVLKINIGTSTSRDIIVTDGLPFSTGCSFRATTGSGDTDTTSPTANASAVLAVGS